mmetsp:Transcript_94587/g.305373  ORF Transcript_94587/g.305373 Transcript_94587/m.305373 type:complete len:255 (-) Transcript_94587:108-872(-)
MVAMEFALGTFFHFWLLTVLADLGDKTFMLIAVFATWCPICGIRDNSAGLAALEYLLLFLGSSGALVLRTILLAVGVNPFAWDGFCEVAATVILLVIGLRATYEWQRAVASPLGCDPAVGPLGVEEQRPIADDPEAKGYGTTDSWLQEPPQGWFKVLCTALFLPSLTILFAEAGDRSQGVLMSAEHHRVDLALGASIGFINSVVLAVCCGYLVKRQVTVRWLLFMVFALVWLTCLSCLRDALVRLVLGSVPMRA